MVSINNTAFLGPGEIDFGRHMADKAELHLSVFRPSNYIPGKTYLDKVVENSLLMAPRQDKYAKEKETKLSPNVYTSRRSALQDMIGNYSRAA